MPSKVVESKGFASLTGASCQADDLMHPSSDCENESSQAPSPATFSPAPSAVDIFSQASRALKKILFYHYLKYIVYPFITYYVL